MQTTEAEEISEKPSVVRSVRFLREQWTEIVDKTNALGIPVGRFLRNAALKAAGIPTEADDLRKLAASIDQVDKAPVKTKAPAKAAKTAKKRR